MNQATPVGANTTVARRPQPTDFKPLQQLTVGELLEDPRVFKAMADSAPQHLSPQRLLRVMAQALRKTPKLGLCNPLSLLGAMISCASLGLEPNTPLGHVYLIPFAKRAKVNGRWQDDGYEINLIIGYQGLIDLARRSGSLVSIHADVVYEGDEFEFEYGSNMHLRHVPIGVRETRKPIYAYAHAKLEDGEAFEVWPYAEVLRIRDATQGYKKAMEGKASGERNWASAPWVAYEHPMSCKTMVRALSKWLPKSIEFATAVQMDSLAERGMIDFQAIANQPMLAHDPDSVTIDQETGEIMDTAKKPEPKPQQTVTTAAAKPEPPKKAGPPPTPGEVAAAAEKAAKEAAAKEAAEREADRLQREAHGEEVTVSEEENTTVEEEDDGWDVYMEKMVAELKSQTTHKDAAATNVTFRDAIVGAVDRKEITEQRGDVLLAAWNPAALARLGELQPPSKAKAK